ncbi:MAG: CerR family C-terminal domain-containing protein [Deltaproteobacteria bacterium]|nr:CerR family C-terminal domain-containing protein [Deltaproteobacteria bacterium]
MKKYSGVGPSSKTDSSNQAAEPKKFGPRVNKGAFGKASQSNGFRTVSIKEAFLKAGAELFGDFGLDGTSTRALARKANANISGIVYHFGSKEGLYQAVLEHIVARFDELTASTRKQAKDRLAALAETTPVSRPEILSITGDLILTVFRALDEKLKIKNAEKVILREQTNPTRFYSILYHGFMDDIITICMELVARYSNGKLVGDKLKICTYAIIGQFTSFLMTKEAFMRNLGVKRFSSGQMEIIRLVIMGNIEACLNSWI